MPPWTVMISSTMDDLTVERDAARAAVLDAKMVPWTAEIPPGQLLGLSPEQFCRRLAEECNLYLLIIGDKYGYIPNDQPEFDSVSITHMEFRWARGKSRRKVLVFIKSGAMHTQDPHLKRFIAEAQDFQHGYLRPQLFTSPQHLREQIAQALSQWADAAAKGMLTYLEQILNTWGTYADPVTKTNIPIHEAVPIMVRVLGTGEEIDSRERTWHFQNYVPDVLEFGLGLVEDITGSTSTIRQARAIARTHRGSLMDSAGTLLNGISHLLQDFRHSMPRSFTDLAGIYAWFGDLVRPIASQTTRVGELRSLLEQLRRLLLIGEPGVGKSVMMRMLACDLADQALKTTNLTQSQPPLAITAVELAQRLSHTPAYRMIDLVEERAAGTPGADIALASALAHGTLILLVDGLDEVQNLAMRLAIVRFLTNEAATLQTVVSMRPAALAHSDVTSWQICRIEPLSYSARSSLAQRALTHANPVTGINLADHARLLEQLNTRDDLRAWSANPLLLTLIALEFARSGTLPTSRAQLYQHAIERLVDIDERQDPLAQRLTRQEIESALRRIALTLLQRGQTTVSIDEIAIFGSNSTKGTPLPEHAVAELLDRSTLLQVKGEGRWGFTHLTLQEYCAAVELSGWPLRRITSFVIQRRLSSRWDQVTRLLVGELDRQGKTATADALIQALVLADRRRIKQLRTSDPLHLSLVRAAQCQRDRLTDSDSSDPLRHSASWLLLQRRWMSLWRASRIQAQVDVLAPSVMDALGPIAMHEIQSSLTHRLRLKRLLLWLLRISIIAYSLIPLLFFVLLSQITLLLNEIIPGSVPENIVRLIQVASTIVLSIVAIGLLAHLVWRWYARRRQPPSYSDAFAAVRHLWPASLTLVAALVHHLSAQVISFVRSTIRILRLLHRLTPRWARRMYRKRNVGISTLASVAVHYGSEAVELLYLIDGCMQWLFSRLENRTQRLPRDLSVAAQGSNWFIRVTALCLIGSFDTSAVDALSAISAATHCPDELTQLAALRALRRIGPEAKPAVDDVLAMLHSSVEELFTLEPRDRMGDSTLESSDGHHRGDTTENDDSPVEGLKREIEAFIVSLNDNSRDRRTAWERRTGALLDTIAAIDRDRPEAISELARLLDTNDAQVRTFALHNLGMFGDAAQALVPSVAAALEDESRSVVNAAFTALESFGPTARGALPTICQKLSSDDHNVRVAALSLIGQLGAEAEPALPEVAERVSDVDDAVALAAVKTLVKLESEARGAVPTLLTTLRQPDPSAGAAKLRLLETIGRFHLRDVRVSVILDILPDLLTSLPEVAGDAHAVLLWTLSQYYGELPRIDSLSVRSAPYRNNVDNFEDLVQRVSSPSLLSADRGMSYPRRDRADLASLPKFETDSHAGTSRQSTVESFPPSLQALLTRLQRRWECFDPVIQTMVDLLNDDDDTIGDAAMHALEALGPFVLPAVPTLSQLVAGKEVTPTQASLRAVHVLSKTGNMSGLTANQLGQLLHRDNDNIHVLALNGLRTLGTEALPALPDLLWALQQDWDSKKLTRVMDTIASLGHQADSAIPTLFELLYSSDDSFIFPVVRTIRVIGGGTPLVTSKLIQLLTRAVRNAETESDREITFQLVGALYGSGDTLAPHVSTLRKLARRGNPELAQSIQNLLRSEVSPEIHALSDEPIAIQLPDKRRHALVSVIFEDLDLEESNAFTRAVRTAYAFGRLPLRAISQWITVIQILILVGLLCDQVIVQVPQFSQWLTDQLPMAGAAIYAVEMWSTPAVFLVCALVLLSMYAVRVLIDLSLRLIAIGRAIGVVDMTPIVFGLNWIQGTGRFSLTWLPQLARMARSGRDNVRIAAVRVLREMLPTLEET